jgi:hypothetical protein
LMGVISMPDCVEIFTSVRNGTLFIVTEGKKTDCPTICKFLCYFCSFPSYLNHHNTFFKDLSDIKHRDKYSSMNTNIFFMQSWEDLFPASFYFRNLKMFFNFRNLKVLFNFRNLKVHFNFRNLKVPFNFRNLKVPFNFRNLKVSFNFRNLKVPFNFWNLKMPFNFRNLKLPFNFRNLKVFFNFRKLKVPFNFSNFCT